MFFLFFSFEHSKLTLIITTSKLIRRNQAEFSWFFIYRNYYDTGTKQQYTVLRLIHFKPLPKFYKPCRCVFLLFVIPGTPGTYLLKCANLTMFINVVLFLLMLYHNDAPSCAFLPILFRVHYFPKSYLRYMQ